MRDSSSFLVISSYSSTVTIKNNYSSYLYYYYCYGMSHLNSAQCPHCYYHSCRLVDWLVVGWTYGWSVANWLAKWARHLSLRWPNSKSHVYASAGACSGKILSRCPCICPVVYPIIPCQHRHVRMAGGAGKSIAQTLLQRHHMTMGGIRWLRVDFRTPVLDGVVVPPNQGFFVPFAILAFVYYWFKKYVFVCVAFSWHQDVSIKFSLFMLNNATRIRSLSFNVSLQHFVDRYFRCATARIWNRLPPSPRDPVVTDNSSVGS